MGYIDEVLRDRPFIYAPLWESSGTVARDWSGTRNNGAITGSPTLGNQGLRAESSKSMLFASGKYVQHASNAAYSAANVAIEGWIYRTGSVPAGFATILMENNLINSYKLGVDTSNRLNFTRVNVAHHPSTFTIAANTLYYVACTVVGTTLTFFVNGKQVDQQTITALTAGTQLIDIGSDSGAATTTYFPGFISDVAAYLSLAPVRIRDHYLAGRGMVAVRSRRLR